MQDKKDLFAQIRLMYFMHLLDIGGCKLRDRLVLIRAHMNIQLSDENYMDYCEWEDSWPRAKGIRKAI